MPNAARSTTLEIAAIVRLVDDLTAREQLVALRLIRLIAISGTPITEDETLPRRLATSPQAWTRFRVRLLPHFAVEGDRWGLPRADGSANPVASPSATTTCGPHVGSLSLPLMAPQIPARSLPSAARPQMRGAGLPTLAGAPHDLARTPTMEALPTAMADAVEPAGADPQTPGRSETLTAIADRSTALSTARSEHDGASEKRQAAPTESAATTPARPAPRRQTMLTEVAASLPAARGDLDGMPDIDRFSTDTAITLLGQFGIGESQARSFISTLYRDYDRGCVIAAIDRAVRRRHYYKDPRAFIRTVLKEFPRKSVAANEKSHRRGAVTRESSQDIWRMDGQVDETLPTLLRARDDRTSERARRIRQQLRERRPQHPDGDFANSLGDRR